MTKSETMLATAIDNAKATAVYPPTMELTKAILIGSDRLDRIEICSANCGRAWTLNKARQAAVRINRALAVNNGGAA
jgi:hypothetical protein